MKKYYQYCGKPHPSKFLIISTAFLLILLKCHPAISFQNVNNDYIPTFKISQETRSTNGVLSCGPTGLDKRILNLICFNSIYSVRDYEKWLDKKIKYKKDNKWDVWAHPQKTLQREYGDCEDFAFLTASVLRIMGFAPKVVAFRTEKGRHAVCVFKKNGRYLWFDITRLKKTEVSTLSGFAEYIFKEYKCKKLLELYLETNNSRVLFRKTKG